MNEYLHLALHEHRERELTERLEHQRLHGSPQRTPMRTRTARTLHRVADLLEAGAR